MLTKSQKVSYLVDSVLHYGSPIVCPSCGGTHATEVDRKFMVTRLFECDKCKLYFRHPSDSAEVNKKFYQKEYREGDGITTYMPSKAELEELKKMDFTTDSNKNAVRLQKLFACLFGDLKGVKVLDYGASWGYVSYQFRAFGMDVESYEISVPRASFGNQSLGLRIHTSERDLRNGNDIFFSSHVIEHVPSPGRMLDLGKKLLHKDGYLVTICPNGSPEYRAKDPQGFHAAWGKVHPNYLNAAFFQNKYKSNPYFITTAPFNYEKVRAWDKRSQVVDSQLENEEILAIAKPGVLVGE